MKMLWESRVVRIITATAIVAIVLTILLYPAVALTNGGFAPRYVALFGLVPKALIASLILVALPMALWDRKALIGSCVLMYLWQPCLALLLYSSTINTPGFGVELYLKQFWPLWLQGPGIAICAHLLRSYFDRRLKESKEYAPRNSPLLNRGERIEL